MLLISESCDWITRGGIVSHSIGKLRVLHQISLHGARSNYIELGELLNMQELKLRYYTDPSGMSWQCDGKAIGSGSEGANSSLQEPFNKVNMEKILKRSSMCYSSGKVDGLIQAQIESGTNSAIHFKTRPNINKELFSNENILGLKDPNRPFPTCPPGDAGVSLLRWRMLSTDESLVPLTINCWTSVCGGDSYVCMEYEASTMFDLHNLVISYCASNNKSENCSVEVQLTESKKEKD
ncbi:hypothetical protein MKW98_021219 [Papaver atlanticum]|uniref:Coatomer subunit delta n=1 Tax=Papaver atlanticum TaxID=357466 RepID=A0AAD4SAX2_9MAGN|nr:hypothetical protein MKW98_021219 [Papaver atlanticum]